MVCLQQERENLTNQLSANPAALKAWLESFGVIRAWSKSYLGGIEWLTGFVWGCFDKLHQKPFWHYKHPQVEDGCDEYQNLYFTRSHKTKGAHEYWHNSKILGGVQKNNKGSVFGALSEAILALQTSSA